MKQMNDIANKYLDEIIEMRHSIHEYPEIGFEEIETGKKVMAFLDKVGIPYRFPVAKTGIIATIDSGKAGKTVLLRGDMDALVMNEDPGNPIVSKVINRMHACGHDGHTSGLAFAGAILNEMKDQFVGKVVLMFQPAEEELGGALPMIEEGVLEGVDGAFGTHLWGSGLEGTMTIKEGAQMAAPDAFFIKVVGKGGHGAMPHMCVDPIVIASSIVMQVQSIVSRQINPLESVVVSFGSIHGGSAFNVIPSEVTLSGTIRTLSVEHREFVHKQIQRIAESTAESMGAKAEFTYVPKYPVLINDSMMVDIAKTAFGKVLGDKNIIPLVHPSMGGEDFAFVAQRVPSAFIYLGISKDLNHPVNHHHPQFQWDDANLKPLAMGMAQCAIDFLSK